VDRDTYGAHFAEIQRWLRRGESYEACYTYRITARTTADPLAAYLRLRRANPAPYGAYLRFGDRHVLSSSPERFLTVDAAGWAETKPVKGTAARDPLRDDEVRAELAADEKNRSENLMIVDLLRNDLGRVCLPGTVRVPSLMAVESYATVHHLVSTVRGRLRPEVHALDCVDALFPGGSMTGAPKERTVQLLAGLETSPRGVYSGCLGWIGVDGTADLSIVIRTAVQDGDRVTIGVGGAVTVLSDVDEEWAETRVKAAAVLRALDPVGAPPVG
jgi:para-aminobenzoate synthetase